MADGLKIKIGADIGEALSGIKQVNTDLQKLDRSASKIGDSFVKTSGSTNIFKRSVDSLKSSFSLFGQTLSGEVSQLINSGGGIGAGFEQLALNAFSSTGALLAAGAAVGLFAVSIANLAGAFDDNDKKAQAFVDGAKKWNEQLAKTPSLFKDIIAAADKSIDSIVSKLDEATLKTGELNTAIIRSFVAQGILSQQKDLISKLLSEQGKNLLQQQKFQNPFLGVPSFNAVPQKTITQFDSFGRPTQKVVTDTVELIKQQINTLQPFIKLFDSEITNIINTDKPEGTKKKVKELKEEVLKLKRAFDDTEPTQAKLDLFNGPTASPGKQTGKPVSNISKGVIDSGLAVDALQQKAQTAANIFNNTLGPAINNAFQAAITGTQSFGQAFASAFRGIIVQLTATIAKTAILAAILSAITGKAGVKFLGGASGFNNIFGALLGKGFAGGGVSTGPKSGYLALLHGTEAIFNESQMKALGNLISNGGQQTTLIPDLKISGEDLFVSFNRVAVRRGRNY